MVSTDCGCTSVVVHLPSTHKEGSGINSQHLGKKWFHHYMQGQITFLFHSASSKACISHNLLSFSVMWKLPGYTVQSFTLCFRCWSCVLHKNFWVSVKRKASSMKVAQFSTLSPPEAWLLSHVLHLPGTTFLLGTFLSRDLEGHGRRNDLDPRELFSLVLQGILIRSDKSYSFFFP